MNLLIRVVFQYGALIGGACIIGSQFGTDLGWAAFLLGYAITPPIPVTR